MSVIELNPTNCRNCYKCIRECPIKAIEFKDGRAKIVERECILCGVCVQSCPQNAKYIRDDTQRAISLLETGKPVYVSVAPSWRGWYHTDDFTVLAAALKKLGFAGAEETAIGAAETSRAYMDLMAQGSMKSIIATACSSAVMLVERRYPELIPMLAPVSSPMMAHARMMREAYGDIKVVFIGPCLSKKDEAADPLAGGVVNLALTFSAVDRWMAEAGVRLEEADAETRGLQTPRTRLYPKPSGILATIPEDCYGKYRHIAVDGMNGCMELFESIRSGQLTGVFAEVNVCAGGCMGGPVMRMGGLRALAVEQYLTDGPMPHDERYALSSTVQTNHPRVFANRSERLPIPSEEEIKKILGRIGKSRPEQELNCGSCGYPTCRDKAIAVYQGRADINMCLPFFRERAENLSNMVMEHSLNAIVALDEDLTVQELNPTAEALFGVPRVDAIGMPISEFYGETAFDEARATGQPVIKKASLLQNGNPVEETFIYIHEHNMYLAFVKDISEEETRQAEMTRMRERTIDTAQQVIEKQMRVAQEIASLLGETTAETKVALTNLKKSMSDAADPSTVQSAVR